MRKKELIIDDYIKEIKNNKLEIINSSSSNKDIRDTITVSMTKEKDKDKDKDIQDNKDNKDNKEIKDNKDNDNGNNYLLELTCLVRIRKLKYLTINNKRIIQINSNLYTYINNLELLDLSHNYIGKLSKKITDLQNLKILNLNDNYISVLPSFLKDIKSLKELYLNNNKIELIPSSIQYFPALKILHLSQNHIEQLPIEIGLIKTLESLYIDKNEFTEIPSTLCYLEQLKSISLEWFEFLDPELNCIQNDPYIIDTLKKFLKNKLLNSVIYVDLQSFIIKMSDNIQIKLNEEKFEKENLEDIKNFNFCLKDVFYALNNNYIGVIKSFVNDNKDLIKAKDSLTNKNLLYLAIQNNKKKIYDFLLSKVDINTITNNALFLFKVIRSRNYSLFLKLVKLGFSLNSTDSKLNNVYHILFSVFNKNYEQCVQIGNYLIENNVPGYNNFNTDGWAPIHIAAKYSKYVCFEWIGYINDILSKQKRETFNINLLGKNNYTAFHLTCFAYNYSECVILLNLGSNLLLRATDGKLPKNTTYNFFLTKMLFKKEQELFYNKYIINNLVNININNINNISNATKKGLLESKSFQGRQKILFTFDNNYDIKHENKITFVNSERSKSEIICNNEKYSLLEKYQILMTISLSNSKEEVSLRIKEIIKDINFKYTYNHIIICDVLNIIQNYNLYEFHYDLKKKLKSLNDNKKTFLIKEINAVILFLEKNKGKKMGTPREKFVIENSYFNKNRNNKSFHLMKKSNVNKYLNMTETDMNNCLINSNEMNLRMPKKNFGVPGFQKIKEKKVQESITSIDFED